MPRSTSVLAVVALLAWSRPSLAQPTFAEVAAEAAVARSLFDEAQGLLRAGRAHEALAKLEDSVRHDATPAALLALADCYRFAERTASAWGAYHRAEEAARAAGDTASALEAARRVGELEPRLSRLRIVVSGSQPRSVLVLGNALPESRRGMAIPLDPGTVRVEATSPGMAPFSKEAELRIDGGTVEIEVPELRPAPSPERPRLAPAGPATPAARVVFPISPPSSHNALEIAGVTLLAAGGASALTGFFAIYVGHSSLSEGATWAMGSMLAGGCLVGVIGYVMLLKRENKIAAGPRRPAVAAAPVFVKSGGGVSFGVSF